MPRADGVLMATRPNTLEPVDGFARHGFLGANTVVLGLLEANRGELGVTAAGLDATVARTREFLKGAAGIAILSANRSEDSLEVVIEVVNNTGHKLPTGYPSRRAWINFQVLDGDGNRLFQSGRMRSDGSIVGVNADNNPPNYEPHWRVITRESQVQVYESIMGDTEGVATYTLLAGAQYLKDNRIPPAGFDKQQVPQDVAVVGRAMDDRDFNAGKDRVIYRIPVTATGPLVVKAALRYQPLSAAYLADLFRDSDLPLVARLQRYWDNADVRVETIARVTHRVE